MASQPSPLYDRIKQTATAFIHSHDESRANNDITALSSTLAPSCRRYFAPSFFFAQVPALASGRTNKEYEAQMLSEMTQTWAKWETTIKEIVVDEYARKAVVTSLHDCTTYQDQMYPFEFVFTLSMSDDGASIEKVIEFVDTGLVAKFMSEQKEIPEHLQAGPK